MKTKNLFYTTFILFLIIISCNENNLIERGYPKVITNDVTENSENGAVFNGEINNFENLNIIEYGFIWDIKEDLQSINNVEKKVVGSNFYNGKFSAKINSTLIESKSYVVKAYAVTDNYTIYGNPTTFTSKGSNSAIITSLEPSEGVWGDTIKIKGKDFSYIKINNLVTFSDIESQVIESNDTIITCIIPPVENILELIPKLKSSNKEVISPINFKINAPEITSISTLTGTFRDEIIVKGNNLGKKEDYNQFYFGNVLAPIEFIDNNTIKAFVPDEIENKTTELKLISNSISTIYNENFTLLNPKIINKITNVFTDDKIIFEVENLHPLKEKNIITFENVTAEIEIISSSKIEVTVPIGPFPNRTAKLKLKVLDMEYDYDADIKINNKWVQVSTSIPFRYNGHVDEAVVANNNAYIIAQEKDYDYTTEYQKKYLWKFNDIDLSWEKSDLPFNIDGYESYNSVLTSDGTNLYLYIPNDNNDFWEYSTTNNIWSKKLKFPGLKRNKQIATHFSVNNEIYIGLGSSYVPYTTTITPEFYKYTPASNSWTQLNNAPISRRTFSSKFIINDIVYLSGGGTTTGHIDCYAYNYKDDSWTRIADLDLIFRRFSGFSINGYGYILNVRYTQSPGASLRYNPVQNVWEESYEIEKFGRIDYYSFVLNGKAYVGGGSSYYNDTLTDLYQFIP